MCNPDTPITSEMCSCNCTLGNDTCTTFSGDNLHDSSTCCSRASECLQEQINQSLAGDSSRSWQCSAYSNQPADQNRSNYSLLPQGHLFVFDTIEFDCEGCIQSISFYLDQTTNAADNTSFTLSVWRPHTSVIESSIMFVSVESAMLTFNSQPVTWNNVYKAESTVKSRLCFEPGDKLGIALPQSFTGKILTPKYLDSVAYKQCLSVCSVLNEVLFEDAEQKTLVPLIELTVAPSGNVYFSVCTILKGTSFSNQYIALQVLSSI